MEILQPPDWSRPRGFSHGIAAQGRMVFVSGMIGCDEHGKLGSSDFIAQTQRALENILAVLAEAKAKPEHIVRMTWYVVDKQEYTAAWPAIGEVYRKLIGKHYPAMTAVEVSALVEDEARVEIEVTAVVPT